jgi:hypothetical protein
VADGTEGKREVLRELRVLINSRQRWGEEEK